MSKIEQEAWNVYVKSKLQREITYRQFVKAYGYHQLHGSKPIMALINYGLPSNLPRLWIIDLENNKLLLNTYVSHGIAVVLYVAESNL